MANVNIVRKLENGNVILNINGVDSMSFTPDMQVVIQDLACKVRDKSGSRQHVFRVDEVVKVVRDDGTETNISDVNTLFFELSNFFFFKLNGGSGSGTGWDGTVQFRSDLPITLGDPQVGSIYLVTNPTTILLGAYTTYQSGLYIRDTDTGSLSDWRRLNVKVRFTDGEFAVVNSLDQSKQAKFNTSLLTTATVRTYSTPDKSGTLALTSDVPNVNTLSINLDDSLSEVTRVFAGGRTTFTITHNFNSKDFFGAVIRLSDDRIVGGWREENVTLNTVELSRNGNIANGLFRFIV